MELSNAFLTSHHSMETDPLTEMLCIFGVLGGGKVYKLSH
jgi:hypothetical protein